MNQICSADLWQKTAFLTPPGQVGPSICEGQANATLLDEFGSLFYLS